MSDPLENFGPRIDLPSEVNEEPRELEAPVIEVDQTAPFTAARTAWDFPLPTVPVTKQPVPCSRTARTLAVVSLRTFSSTKLNMGRAGSGEDTPRCWGRTSANRGLADSAVAMHHREGEPRPVREQRPRAVPDAGRPIDGIDADPDTTGREPQSIHGRWRGTGSAGQVRVQRTPRHDR